MEYKKQIINPQGGRKKEIGTNEGEEKRNQGARQEAQTRPLQERHGANQPLSGKTGTVVSGSRRGAQGFRFGRGEGNPASRHCPAHAPLRGQP